MGLPKWQNITQPSSAIFSFLSWDNYIGCQCAKNTSARVRRVFLVNNFFGSTVLSETIGLKALKKIIMVAAFQVNSRKVMNYIITDK